MLHAQRGSIYRVVLGFFIILAFCFALIWPQYTKKHNANELTRAAEMGRMLAQAEEKYKQNHGDYTAQFTQLDITLPCPEVMRGGKPLLECSHYTYELENSSIIKVVHKQLPVWLEVEILTGTATCKYDLKDWAGQDLCARMQ